MGELREFDELNEVTFPYGDDNDDNDENDEENEDMRSRLRILMKPIGHQAGLLFVSCH